MSRYGYASPVWMIELNMSVAYPVNDKSIMLGQNYQDFIRIVICNHHTETSISIFFFSRASSYIEANINCIASVILTSNSRSVSPWLIAPGNSKHLPLNPPSVSVYTTVYLVIETYRTTYFHKNLFNMRTKPALSNRITYLLQRPLT